ncbi:MAG: hypothetical protein NC223_02990 [Butyrivibrio sp.]|nr:hypothetical protein [Butyrivibrio sp.]
MTNINREAAQCTYDISLKKWRMKIQLDKARVWFLSVFIKEDNTFSGFSLDEESASDSHYEFKDEAQIRKSLFKEGDEEKYLHEVFIAFVKKQGIKKLFETLQPYITARYHYD